MPPRLRFNFVGTSNDPGDVGTARVTPIAAAAGVADLVREQPRRVPYLEALAVLAHSNGILLIGSDEVHYTASKIYPALLCGRPWLSLVIHFASSAHAVLAAAGGGRALAFSNDADLEALVPDLAEAMTVLATSSENLGRVRPEAMAPYTARAIAGRFADVFERARASCP